jgi:hypothetical protein
VSERYVEQHTKHHTSQPKTERFAKGEASDYAAALEVCHNLRDTLSAIGVKERYSGVTSGILQAVVGETTEVLPLSQLIEVCNQNLYFIH